MLLFISALAPSAALLYYFYMRDKYEKEPRKKLFKAFFLGCVSVIPVLFAELNLNVFDPNDFSFMAVGYTSFLVAGLAEEGFKFLTYMFFFYADREVDEMYDGIVYCVFISLGFATIENIGYVLNSDISTAIMRSLTAVPAHALFAVAMGYYLGIAKFVRPTKKIRYIVLGLLMPVLLHGIYDFILLSHRLYLLILFIPYMLYLWRRGLRNVKELVENSPFKDHSQEE